MTAEENVSHDATANEGALMTFRGNFRALYALQLLSGHAAPDSASFVLRYLAANAFAAAATRPPRSRKKDDA